MDPIRTLIIDDETGSREVLRKLLEKYFHGEIEVVGEAANADAGHKLAEELDPALVFLDIQMPRGDGFSFLRRFEKVPFEVIFVTSYDQYAIHAIRFNALDYLLKPVDIPELKTAVQKAVQRIEKSWSSHTQVVNLLHSLDPVVTERKVPVHAGEKVKLLNVQDIEYIEADRRYCHLFMTNNESYTTARPLSDFDDYLGNTPSFVRISKSFLLNVNCIKEYSKGEPFIILLNNGRSFEIPRRKKPEVLEKLKNK